MTFRDDLAVPSNVRVLGPCGDTSKVVPRLTLILHLHVTVIRRPGDVQRFADVVDAQSVVIV